MKSIKYLLSFLVVTLVLSQTFAWGQDTVEINGDSVEYSVDGQTVTAKGNVVVRYHDSRLLCDEADFSRSTNIAHAKGNVRLITKQGEVLGDKLTFDYNSMQGDLNGAKLISSPYYGAGRYVGRVSDNQLVVRDGYITTSDWDKPEYRVNAKKIEIYPGDKMVARGITFKLGPVPLFYLPKYTQNLKDRRPWFTIIPGSSKDWGDFVLTRFNFFVNENFKGAVHVDNRAKYGLATGLDVNYNTVKYGEGVFKTYYTNEHRTEKDRFWDKKEVGAPSSEREKYKVEWRHKWQIDKTTTAIGQFYKITDPNFLKDYFEREFKEDPNPQTYFLLTKNMPQGTLGLRTDVRVNDYQSNVDRLPELSYNMPDTELAETGLYWKSISTVANLTANEPRPSDFRRKTVRVDTDNELSYPMKVNIIEFKPFIGSRETYYSRTRIPSKGDAFRSQLQTGATLSTKFYRTFDVEMHKWGMDISRLRHIITPSVSYSYDSKPTVDSDDLDSFDDVDALAQAHSIIFSLENKLQTKRNNKTVDLLRAVVDVDYPLKEDPLGSGFNMITTDVDFSPADWLSLYFDSQYDTRNDRLEDANVDLYLNGKGKWRFGIGKRFAREVDDLITTDIYYKINPMWELKTYNRVDVSSGEEREFDIVLTRDLHTWQMDVNFNQTLGQGSEIMLIFRLKAFPGIGIESGTSFNKRKPGSQL